MSKLHTAANAAADAGTFKGYVVGRFTVSSHSRVATLPRNWTNPLWAPGEMKAMKLLFEIFPCRGQTFL